MLWLLSYVGLGLALTLRNRPVSIVGDRKKNQNHERDDSEKMMGLVGNMDVGNGNDIGLRAYQYDDSLRNAVLDWFVYDSQSKNIARSSTSVLNNERIVRLPGNKNELLDDLFSSVFKSVPKNDDSRRESVPFVYEGGPFFGQHRTRKRPDFKEKKGPVGSEINEYVDVPLVTNSFILDTRFDRRSAVAKASIKKSGELPESSDSLKKYERKDVGLSSSSTNFELNNSLGKRNNGLSGHREMQGKSQQAQQEPPSLPGGASIASQFMLRSARGNRQYDVPQIGEPLFIFI